MVKFSSSYDVLVVGTGAAGLTAALTVALRGMSVAVIEKTDFFGGTTATSGGVLWIPDNGCEPRKGPAVADDPEQARQYLHNLTMGRVASERIDRFVPTGRKMVTELAARTKWLKFRQVPSPDYYPHVAGVLPKGRGLEVDIIDGNLLGDELPQLRPLPPAVDLKGLTPTADEVFDLMTMGRTWKGKVAAARMFSRFVGSKVKRQRLLSAGQALVARLRLSLRDLEVPVFLQTALTELIVDAGTVTGIRVMHAGEVHEVKARAVVLAAGGFAANQAMRDAYHPKPTSTRWSAAAEGDQGDAIGAGMAIGAATDLMDHVWGMPTVLVPGDDGSEYGLLTIGDRCQPGTIVVDQSGARFGNEAISYHEFRQRMLSHQREANNAAPSWLVFDQRAKNRYLLLNTPPRVPFPKNWLRSGAVIKAPSIEKLAEATGLPFVNLAATITRFNQHCEAGRDADFGRGETFYDRRYADPRQTPNPALGQIDQGPFYAARLYPGDLGTCGGLLVDENSRVLNEQRQPIAGLYAAGNTAASVMGGTYAGGGATIGAAMVAAYSAGLDIAAASDANTSVKSRAGETVS